MVDSGGGRGRVEGVRGGETFPRVGEEGFRTEEVSKPLQPRGLKGLLICSVIHYSFIYHISKCYLFIYSFLRGHRAEVLIIDSFI